MSDDMDWLPPLVLFGDYGGNWGRYIDVVYGYFCEDLRRSRLSLRSKRISCPGNSASDGREATFWHMVSTGSVEDDRIPDLRRCERIRWPRALIEAANVDQVPVWGNQRSSPKRNNQQRLLIALPDFSYVVVLSDRGEYAVIITAYPVDQTSQQRKLEREYDDFIHNG